METSEVERLLINLMTITEWKRIEVCRLGSRIVGYCVDGKGNTYHWINNRLVRNYEGL